MSSTPKKIGSSKDNIKPLDLLVAQSLFKHESNPPLQFSCIFLILLPSALAVCRFQNV